MQGLFLFQFLHQTKHNVHTLHNAGRIGFHDVPLKGQGGKLFKTIKKKRENALLCTQCCVRCLFNSFFFLAVGRGDLQQAGR
jgi:hypothetical protein